MHNDKYQCNMAAFSYIYHLPTIISLNKSHTKKPNLMKNVIFLEEKKLEEQTISKKMTRQKEQQDEAEKEKRRQETVIKWQPWDSRHPSFPSGALQKTKTKRERESSSSSNWIFF